MTACLKAEKLLVVLASDPNLFQSFAPGGGGVLSMVVRQRCAVFQGIVFAYFF